MTSFQRKWQCKFLTRKNVTRIFQSHQQWTSLAFVSCGRDHFPIIYKWSVFLSPCYPALVTVLSYISSVAQPAQSWADIKSFESISFLRPVPSPRQHNSSHHQAGAGQMLLGLCWPGSKTLPWLPSTLAAPCCWCCCCCWTLPHDIEYPQSICTWPPDIVSGPAQGIWTQFYWHLLYLVLNQCFSFRCTFYIISWIIIIILLPFNC